MAIEAETSFSKSIKANPRFPGTILTSWNPAHWANIIFKVSVEISGGRFWERRVLFGAALLINLASLATGSCTSVGSLSFDRVSLGRFAGLGATTIPSFLAIIFDLVFAKAIFYYMNGCNVCIVSLVIIKMIHTISFSYSLKPCFPFIAFVADDISWKTIQA